MEEPVLPDDWTVSVKLTEYDYAAVKLAAELHHHGRMDWAIQEAVHGYLFGDGGLSSPAAKPDPRHGIRLVVPLREKDAKA